MHEGAAAVRSLRAVGGRTGPAAVSGYVMSAASIGSGKAGGYARYLEGKTVAPERGDYYLTPEGSPTEAPGRWLSDRETLQRLRIDPDGPVVGREFIALMDPLFKAPYRFLIVCLGSVFVPCFCST